MHLYKISKSNVGIGINIQRGADNQVVLAVVPHIPSGCLC